jgi:hypothetical protein
LERSLTQPTAAADQVLLDHASEFVDRVARLAPERFRDWHRQEGVLELLRGDNAFNAGKLYAWAEYEVFREEFDTRFPEASAEACINAFCRLFMKNDVSISRLVEFMEQWLAARGALPGGS